MLYGFPASQLTRGKGDAIEPTCPMEIESELPGFQRPTKTLMNCSKRRSSLVAAWNSKTSTVDTVRRFWVHTVRPSDCASSRLGCSSPHSTLRLLARGPLALSGARPLSLCRQFACRTNNIHDESTTTSTTMTIISRQIGHDIYRQTHLP